MWAGWDACTGLGVVVGNQLLAALQRIFQKKCTLITDRSSFGKEEVDAMLQSGSPAVIQAAFFVTIDGFRAAELGINAGNLTNPGATAPTLTLVPPVSGVSIAATALQPEDPTLPGRVERFTWTYQIAFNNSGGFNVDNLQVVLVATLAGLSSTATLVFTKQPNPYEIDGPISWLSTDLRRLLRAIGRSEVRRDVAEYAGPGTQFHQASDRQPQLREY